MPDVFDVEDLSPSITVSGDLGGNYLDVETLEPYYVPTLLFLRYNLPGSPGATTPHHLTAAIYLPAAAHRCVKTSRLHPFRAGTPTRNTRRLALFCNVTYSVVGRLIS